MADDPFMTDSKAKAIIYKWKLIQASGQLFWMIATFKWNVTLR